MIVSRLADRTAHVNPSTSRLDSVSSSHPALMTTKVSQENQISQVQYITSQSRPVDQVPIPSVHNLRPEELSPLSSNLQCSLEF